MRLLTRLGMLLCLLGWPLCAAAVEPVRVTADDGAVPLLPVTYLVDHEGLNRAQAEAQLATAEAQVAAQVFSHGYNTGTYWAKVEIDVAVEAAGRWYLALELPNFDRLDVYPSWAADAGSGPAFALGDRVPDGRSIQSRFHIQALSLPPGRHTLLFSGRTSSTMTVPLRLWRPDALHASEQSFLILQGFYLGIAILLAGTALIIALYLRQVVFVVYAGNVASHGTLWLILNGVGPGYLWPELARSVEISSHGFVALAVASITAFSAIFLADARVPRIVERAMWLILLVGLVLAAAAFLAPRAYTLYPNAATNLLMLPLATVLIVGTLIALFRGARAARLLMLAWSGLAVGVVLATLRDLGFVPSNALTFSGPQLGSTFEMLVFAVMLAGRLGRLHREKEQLQAQALAASREHEAQLEQRVAERTAALDAANRRLAAIVESAPFPLVIERETDDLVLFMNQRAVQLFGMMTRTAVEQTIPFRFARPAERAAMLTELRNGDITADREVELLRPDGSRFWVFLSAVRIEYDGEPVRLVALNDISSMKALEGYLRSAAAQERDARRIQRQFVEMVSHEFRTPLAVIDATAQNIMVGDPRAQGRVQKIRDAVQRLLSMIQDCLVEDRGAGGRIELNPEPLVLGEVLREAVETARGSAPGHRLQLEVSGGPVHLTGDRRLLDIAVGNLLQNAVKYSPAGSTVRVSLVSGTDAIEIAVADQGGGVPSAERERVFEKYYRSSNTGRTPGAGLGLHLVRLIAEAHGGGATCRDGDGGGSVFSLLLPVSASLAGQADREAVRG